ncbi:MAG: hypothetical protein COW71_13980 [Ignavibacteriales bacterium CG18_big_fil_WC_8_21_14_2_50_31_20]|nr:MAG: hypothetical protein COW71_13980 [Ignavibacteriales bacterium CG18_big_fil_WC_8_21_14_2_50_31_20]
MKKQIYFSKTKLGMVVLLLFLLIPVQQHAQINEGNIEIGKIIKINSKILNEDRTIFISLPTGYEQSNEKYPVIYILDGRANFAFSATIVDFLSRNQRMPRTIVVAIPNTDRDRDFTPSHIITSKTSGGADKFLDFMKEELMPYIDNNYRTESYRTLFGHSLCGMFSIYNLFERPEMFNSFIAVSPYLMYDNNYVVNKIDSITGVKQNLKKDLFITLGNEPAYTESFSKLEELLSKGTENLTWKTSKRESENHASVPLKSLYDGLEFIYSSWRLDNETVEQGLDAIKEHYSKLSDKYGFEVKPNEIAINLIGYQLLAKNEIEKAIEIFKYNAELFPTSANVYDSLGDSQEKAGMKDLAAENYKMAVKLGAENNDINLEIFKQNLERVQNSK